MTAAALGTTDLGMGAGLFAPSAAQGANAKAPADVSGFVGLISLLLSQAGQSESETAADPTALLLKLTSGTQTQDAAPTAPLTSKVDLALLGAGQAQLPSLAALLQKLAVSAAATIPVNLAPLAELTPAVSQISNREAR